MKQVRPIAIYLPQYHPIPENDEWWGKGFTEWTNVTKAKPLFKKHYQPHLPADLGFYDLRLPEIRQAQAELAREYGIHGFCYYHYWFNGKQLLNKPIDEVLKSGQPDFPFCLCWANENWTRSWDGQNSQILLKQDYSFADDISHINYLFKFFKDKRYIRIDNKPFFIVYKPELFPDIKKTISIWRNEALKAGIGELYLGYFEKEILNLDPKEIGFDIAIEFQPNFANLPPQRNFNIVHKILKKLKIWNNVYSRNKILDYTVISKSKNNEVNSIYKRFPCVTPMWDNSARKKDNANIFINSKPKLYYEWLINTIKNFTPYSVEENFIFINAWNEWAEGNHLEPCQKWGRKYLEATKKAVENS